MHVDCSLMHRFLLALPAFFISYLKFGSVIKYCGEVPAALMQIGKHVDNSAE